MLQVCSKCCRCVENVAGVLKVLQVCCSNNNLTVAMTMYSKLRLSSIK